MTTQLETRTKDTWDKFQISLQVIIAVAALGFTILFGMREQETAKANFELAAANKKIAEVQLKSALLPALSSDDPKQRSIAMYLAQATDEAFAAAVADALVLNDPDRNVRKSARSTLEILSQSQQPDVKQSAQKSIDRQAVTSELSDKDLLKELNDAQGYLNSGNPADKEKALQIYRKVVSQLSADSRKKLNEKLLAEAEQDYRNGHTDDAIRKFRALFADYR